MAKAYCYILGAVVEIVAFLGELGTNLWLVVWADVDMEGKRLLVIPYNAVSLSVEELTSLYLRPEALKAPLPDAMRRGVIFKSQWEEYKKDRGFIQISTELKQFKDQNIRVIEVKINEPCVAYVFKVSVEDYLRFYGITNIPSPKNESGMRKKAKVKSRRPVREGLVGAEDAARAEYAMYQDTGMSPWMANAYREEALGTKKELEKAEYVAKLAGVEYLKLRLSTEKESADAEDTTRMISCPASEATEQMHRAKRNIHTRYCIVNTVNHLRTTTGKGDPISYMDIVWLMGAPKNINMLHEIILRTENPEDPESVYSGIRSLANDIMYLNAGRYKTLGEGLIRSRSCMECGMMTGHVCQHVSVTKG